jgi:hypothetical protein
MKLMNRNNLGVRFAASAQESRYTMGAILATENETVATDGHLLARVSMPNMDAKNFPVVDGFKPNGFKRGLIPSDVCQEIERSIPKKTTIPVLGHAAITTEHTDDRGDLLKVAVTDLDTPKVITVREPEGQFPKWDNQSLWATKAPVMDICFDAELLKRIMVAACKFTDKRTNAPIRLRFYGANEAMRFDMVNDDGQELNGLAMPMRAEIAPTFQVKKPIRAKKPCASTQFGVYEDKHAAIAA